MLLLNDFFIQEWKLRERPEGAFTWVHMYISGDNTNLTKMRFLEQWEDHKDTSGDCQHWHKILLGSSIILVMGDHLMNRLD